MLMLCLSVNGQELKVTGSRKAIRTSGDVLVFITPVASLATVLATQDWQGLKQGVFTGVTTLGVTYALKYLVKKERPDFSDNHSFPSMHTSVSFAGAAFIQRRYGWKWGIPAYAVSTYVGWSRVYGKKHDWWDVAAGAGFGAGGAPAHRGRGFGGRGGGEPLSAPVAPISLPVRSRRNITCLSAR